MTVQVRHASGSEMRLYVPGPAIFQGLRLFLRLTPAAADAYRRNVADSNLNLGAHFDLQGLAVGFRLHLFAIQHEPAGRGVPSGLL